MERTNSIEKQENVSRLLCVEDDTITSYFLRCLLDKYFSIDFCDNSDSCNTLMESNKYDLIIMDISIKGEVNGLKLTEQIKNHPLYSDVPVLCYTAHAFNEVQLQAEASGVDMILVKPVSNDKLLTEINKLLEKK